MQCQPDVAGRGDGDDGDGDGDGLSQVGSICRRWTLLFHVSSELTQPHIHLQLCGAAVSSSHIQYSRQTDGSDPPLGIKGKLRSMSEHFVCLAFS